jgi:hypothetical protein
MEINIFAAGQFGMKPGAHFDQRGESPSNEDFQNRRLTGAIMPDDAQSAYVVAAKEAAPTADEVRRFLRSKLPEHMVPASYWRLDKLPLLPSGKIDRKALSPGVGVPLEGGQELVPPRNEAGSKLADIWRELLAVNQVGIGQNFFELGGHSLLVLQMIDRIRRIFELELQCGVCLTNPQSKV